METGITHSAVDVFLRNAILLKQVTKAHIQSNHQFIRIQIILIFVNVKQDMSSAPLFLGKNYT
jgi:hypothetical protein